MNEGTEASDLDLRLAKAEALIARGKQRRALQELWYAEARARGNADAIREMLDFTRTFERRVEPRQRPRFVELVAALEHDANQSSRSPVAPVGAQSSPSSLGCLGLLGLSLGGGVVGALIGALIGTAFYPPVPNQWGPGIGPFYGAIVGLPIGAIALPLLVPLLLKVFRVR